MSRCPLMTCRSRESHISLSLLSKSWTVTARRDSSGWRQVEKRLDNLKNTGTVEPISPEGRSRSESKLGSKDSNMWSTKPDKFTVRIVACGNKTAETYGKVSTTDLDTAMMRFVLSWGAYASSHAVATLDVTAAFLNAPLPPGRVVVMRPPTILLQVATFTTWTCLVSSQGHLWS